MSKVAVISGGSSGIGLSTARTLKNRGYKVYELSRREKGSEEVEHIQADVSVKEEVKKAVDRIYKTEGKIDLVVNNAGYGISGAVEFTDTEEAKKLFDVNFFGMVNMNLAALPYMRRVEKGRIINISSVAAPVPIPFQCYYSAGKAAINSYTLALANEVKPFGISVCAVMPGDIRTGFTAARKKLCSGDEAYSGRISRSVAVMERDEERGMSPEKVGKYICSIALKKRVKPLYAVGAKYKIFSVLAHLLPCGIMNYIVGKIYGG